MDALKAGCPSLASLDVSYNRFEKEGALRLSSLLSSSNSLTDVDLTGATLDNENLEVRALLRIAT